MGQQQDGNQGRRGMGKRTKNNNSFHYHLNGFLKGSSTQRGIHLHETGKKGFYSETSLRKPSFCEHLRIVTLLSLLNYQCLSYFITF